MKNIAMSLLALAGLGLLTSTIIFADVAPEPKKGEKIHNGKIAKAADDKGVIEITPRAAKEGEEVKNISFTTNDKTEVSINKKAAKVADLKEGMDVSVYADGNVAARIFAYAKSETNKKQ